MIAISGLRKLYDNYLAVDDLSFSLAPGQVWRAGRSERSWQNDHDAVFGGTDPSDAGIPAGGGL